MEFYISKHATDQMKLRGIEENIVSGILHSPQQVIVNDDKTIYQSVFTENEKQFLIRIFVNHLKIPNTVITVYKTSKIGKYYEGNL
jgi:hypothetical protein